MASVNSHIFVVRLFLTVLMLYAHIPSPNIIVALLLLYIYITNKNLNVSHINNPTVNKIRVFQILIIIVFIVSMIKNMRYLEYVQSNYAQITGNDIPYLYLKIFLNGFVLIFIFYTAYNYGLYSFYNRTFRFQVYRYIVFLGTFSALVNIIVWVKETGMVISRYNFVSPIYNSPSGGIFIIMISVFLATEYVSNRYLKTGIYFVAILNSIIIVTKSSQLLFIALFITYMVLKYMNISRSRINVLITVIFVVSIGMFLSDNIFNTYSNYYRVLFEDNSYDNMIRTITTNTALELFYTNPVLGIGYGMFGAHNNVVYKGITLGSPHNAFYSILSEWGVVGLLLMISLLAYILIMILKILNNKPNNYDIVVSIYLLSTIALFPIGNWALYPPPSETAYLLYGFVIWMFIGYASLKATSSKEI
jgi:hypothetical protein